MPAVFGVKRNNNTSKIAVIKGLDDTINVGGKDYFLRDLNQTLEKFYEFWDLMETIRKHGYLRAAMSVVGRSAVGSWFTLRRHPELGNNATELHRKRLYKFYMSHSKEWNNIKDYHTIAYKIMIAIMYLRYFGQAAFQVIRDERGRPLGLDFLHGLVIPNVDSEGNFKEDEPAFVQYPTNDPTIKVEFDNPRDIVYLINPDWEGSPMGGTEIEALATFTLPIDIYLQIAAREYMKNRDRPEVVYSLPLDVSEESFDEFVKEIEARWRGPKNIGHSPIAVQGDFSIEELRKLPDSLPYQESRKQAREEELAVVGVSGAKLGITDNMRSSNLRELRREFHESSMVPLFKFIEIGFYEQIHIREFGYDDWEFVFKAPDFMTEIEQATVHMRYFSVGAYNPNEIRSDLGKEPREDEGGNQFIDQMDYEGPSNPPGSPLGGRDDNPDGDGSDDDDDQDPPRGDQHDDEPRDSFIDELLTWRAFTINRMKHGRKLRKFHTDIIPEEIQEIIEMKLSKVTTVKEVVLIFEEVLREVEDVFDDTKI